MRLKEKKLHAFFEPLTLIIPFLLTSCYLASVVGKNTHIARSSNESLKTLSTRKNNCTHINFFFVIMQIRNNVFWLELNK